MANPPMQIQEKVSRLMSRERHKPVLRPQRPLSLKDSVASRRPRRGEATCVTEMSVMMACWKKNNFIESLCSRELKDFYSCVQHAQAASKSNSTLAGWDKGRLPSKEATTLLKRFPNIRTEI